VVIRNLTKPWVLKGRGWCIPSLSFLSHPLILSMIYMVLGFVNIKELQKSHPKKGMVWMVGMECESDRI